MSRARLVIRAFWEFLRYDLVAAVSGFRGVHRQLGEVSMLRSPAVTPEAITEAVDAAASLYWKRARCLQRSIVTARMLRANGFGAELVIGYRMAPFMGHAWVELDGRVLNGSSAYPQKLQILHRA